MNVYQTKEITTEFLTNLVDAPRPVLSALTYSARLDRIEYAFNQIGNTTGWTDLQLSGMYNNTQYAVAFRHLEKGDFVITYTKNEDGLINVILIE
jgi:hypothetical protein